MAVRRKTLKKVVSEAQAKAIARSEADKSRNPGKFSQVMREWSDGKLYSRSGGGGIKR
jgi:hypothetical protein